MTKKCETLSEELDALVINGFVEYMTANGVETLQVTDAGRDFRETVLLLDISKLSDVYALGRLQGLKEAEVAGA